MWKEAFYLNPNPVRWRLGWFRWFWRWSCVCCCWMMMMVTMMGSCICQRLQVLRRCVFLPSCCRIRTAAGGLRSLSASTCFFLASCSQINTLFLHWCFACFAQTHPEGGIVSVLTCFVFLYVFFWDFFLIIISKRFVFTVVAVFKASARVVAVTPSSSLTVTSNMCSCRCCVSYIQ